MFGTSTAVLDVAARLPPHTRVTCNAFPLYLKCLFFVVAVNLTVAVSDEMSGKNNKTKEGLVQQTFA